MSDHNQPLHDPAVDTHLESPLEDNDGTASSDYEHSSPEVSSLNSSAILDHPDDVTKPIIAPAVHPVVSGAVPVVPIAAPVALDATASGAFSKSRAGGAELSTAVVDLNQTMPWKLFYPIASRETILALLKATAINFVLPFINGVFLGFGEICAHELTYRWGWTNSAHVVSVPGRRPANAGDVGFRAAGVSGAGSVGSVSGTNGSGSTAGFAGSRSGIGGLGGFEEDAFATASSRED
ncbi:Mitochondrial inner membrane protein oxa1 [Mortierella claussenii]|nr:Mitochondrial inner membrane protein oxa1 [Mortierella claussenii]